MALGFENPDLALANVKMRDLAALVSVGSDLALVVDDNDVVEDISHNLDSQTAANLAAWKGASIKSTVPDESLPALEKSLERARQDSTGLRFDVSHRIQQGELPIRYAARRIGRNGRMIMMGHDLRPLADLQVRLLSSNRSLELSAKNQKQSEAYYRLLFESDADGMVILDAASGKVREVNPAAARLLRTSSPGNGAKKFLSLFDRSRQADVQALVAEASTSGRSARMLVDIDGDRRLALEAELFRAGEVNSIIVRVADASGTLDWADNGGIEALLRSATEAVVLTDDEGGILWANESFLSLADAPLLSQILGKSLGDLLRWSTVQRQLLFQDIRKHGRVPSFSAKVSAASGRMTDVDLSAVALRNAGQSGVGFVMRESQVGDEQRARGSSDIKRAAEDMDDMIGRVPMKELVKDTTDVIERMCIEAALKLTGDNRASAARVLGLSRQALYLKMSRFGLDEGDGP